MFISATTLLTPELQVMLNLIYASSLCSSGMEGDNIRSFEFLQDEI